MNGPLVPERLEELIAGYPRQPSPEEAEELRRLVAEHPMQVHQFAGSAGTHALCYLK